MLPSPADIRAAAARLRGIIQRTPLVPSPELSSEIGTPVYLKCENLQRTGSFKLRGAFNVLATLSDAERERGVVASSAGNHGLGIALAAKLLGIRARVFVPATAPAVKREGIAALGAEVDESQPDYDGAHALAMRHAAETGRTFVNPCAGAMLLAGQGTIALEVLETLPSVRTIVVPIGGGGLVGGIAALLRAEAPHVRIVGAQTAVTNAMAKSLTASHLESVPVVPTLADGLAGQIDEEGLAIGQFAIDELCVVAEAEVADAIAWASAAHDMRVEGAGAVGIAAARRPDARLKGPAVIVVSGGNIDEARWRDVVAART